MPVPLLLLLLFWLLHVLGIVLIHIVLVLTVGFSFCDSKNVQNDISAARTETHRGDGAPREPFHHGHCTIPSTNRIETAPPFVLFIVK